jgi:hypothetical protein
MKKFSFFLLIAAIIAITASSCQKKSYTCQCKMAFTSGAYNWILQARSERNAKSACAYLNKDVGTDVDSYHDCHLID